MVTMAEIRDVGRRIGERFHPQRVVLFGSRTRGEAGDDSDVDLLVILPFEGRGFHKSMEILNHVNARFPLDVIARRPEDVTRRYDQGDPLIREALDTGTILYERDG